MSYKRVLSIQDISCFGQCSLTVALPIISACGHECSILPSAVLSTHTAGFSGYTVRDLSEDFSAIFNHWKKEGISFDALYTGYLGTVSEIEFIMDFYAACVKKPLLIVDPAMGDNGKLYPAFDMRYVNAMRTLCDAADVIIPNSTEFEFLYGEKRADNKAAQTIDKYIPEKNADQILLITGYSQKNDMTGVMVKSSSGCYSYEHEKMPEDRHGTGDIYSSAFVGAYLSGKEINEAAKIAADYTLLCVKDAQGDKEHFYGVRFERFIPELIGMLGLYEQK